MTERLSAHEKFWIFLTRLFTSKMQLEKEEAAALEGLILATYAMWTQPAAVDSTPPSAPSPTTASAPTVPAASPAPVIPSPIKNKPQNKKGGGKNQRKPTTKIIQKSQLKAGQVQAAKAVQQDKSEVSQKSLDWNTGKQYSFGYNLNFSKESQKSKNKSCFEGCWGETSWFDWCNCCAVDVKQKGKPCPTGQPIP